MTLTLPENPLDLDYEDAVAAKLLSLGYYIETNLTLFGEEKKPILEFDVIATPTNDYQNRKIVEAKSGDLKPHELFFNLFGKTLYTRQKGAWLIHKKPLDDSAKKSIDALSSEMDERTKVSVQTTHFDIRSGFATEDSDSIPTAIEMSEKLRDVIAEVGYFSRQAERKALKKFNDWYKQHEEQARGAKTYRAEVERGLFRTSPSRRVEALYQAFKNNPQISKSLQAGKAKDCLKSSDDISKETWETSNYFYIQYIMSVEFKARVAIIKNAYDAHLEDDHLAKLPASYTNGKEKHIGLGKEKHIGLDNEDKCAKLAFFLQIFIEIFGGFYFPNDAEDVRNLSEATGVPEGDILEYLYVFATYFYPDKKKENENENASENEKKKYWVHKGDEKREGTVNFLKHVPAYMRATGVMTREKLYGESWKYKKISLISNWRGHLNTLLGDQR